MERTGHRNEPGIPEGALLLPSLVRTSSFLPEDFFHTYSITSFKPASVFIRPGVPYDFFP
ncbi:hypothetical protein ARMGADRAFT_1019744 [Armillaria gallica]|uniref:Uncharacterized protein n=1 Tax=Armillaria gallica TaxID=47427 RepID=A0A2H3CGZ4_ARMGA|nr:hypothetical protein ARMGADRAFT_1019744 [Armillaria gallica]